MASGAVSFALERLRVLLKQEAIALLDVDDQIKGMQNELEWMKCFLKDADARQDADYTVRNWVSEIRDTAYDVEDLIDSFILKSARERRSGFTGSIERYFSVFMEWINLHNFSKEIDKIKKRIHSISEKLSTYGIKHVNVTEGMIRANASSSSRSLRRSRSYVAKEPTVGLEYDKNILVAQLLEEEPQLCVISIVGMGGIGKTTLAQKVYNHSDVTLHFNCHAWLCVSQEYNPRDVLKRVIDSFRMPTKENLEMLGSLTEEELETELRKVLEGKKYLVVIDDIWDAEPLENLMRALPDRCNGSRVIITTRNKNVAMLVGERNLLYEIPFLSENEGWKLFCKKVFPEEAGTSSYPADLELLGKRLVRKCGGLPLAIVMLGGLLWRKPQEEWERVLNNFGSHLMTYESRISNILASSYNELSYQLKSCFLYVGLFPEDYVIPTEKLIRLWVAEGFISEGEEAMEDVAEDYLNELINRSMIQVAERSWGVGRVEACSVHDLLRVLSHKKAREENFMNIYGTLKDIPSLSSKSRRCAIHSQIRRYASFEHSNDRLRSLLFFNPDHEILKIEQVEFIHEFKLLRVLDLENIKFEFDHSTTRKMSSLDTIGKLVHLRYLGLRRTNIKMLPLSIGNLRNLQTLELRGDCRLPNVIWKMKQLRHLHGDVGGKLRIDTLTDLQTLASVDIDTWMENELVNLMNLRELDVYEKKKKREPNEISRFHGMAFWNSIAELPTLRSLSLKTMNTYPTLEPLSGCCHLTKLFFNGKIELLPDHYGFPPKLTHLSLYNSQLEQDPMEILQMLLNLRVLKLGYKSFKGKKMVSYTNGFPQLQVLQLHYLEELEEWRVEEGAMPRLRHLLISSCPKLRKVPDEVKLDTLQKFEIKLMPKEFVDRLQQHF